MWWCRPISAYTVGLPTVTTDSVSDVSHDSATVSGSVASNGGSAVTERGICYGTSANPTISGTHVTSGSGTGTFNAILSSLNSSTTYYTRAYATNSAGTGYGLDVQFNTRAPLPSNYPFKDGIQYVNSTYPNKLKTLCYNYSVNEDGLAYIIVENGTTPTYNTKTLVVIHETDGFITSKDISIPTVPSDKNFVRWPFAINGFFGYWASSGRKTNYTIVFKFDIENQDFAHIGSDSSFVQVVANGSTKWPSDQMSCFKWNNHLYVQTTTQCTNPETPVAVCLDASGSDSTYWTSSWVYEAGNNSYRMMAACVAAEPTSTGIVYIGPRGSGSSATATSNIYMWKDTTINSWFGKSGYTNLFSDGSGSLPYGYNLTPNSFSPAAVVSGFRKMPVYGEDPWIIFATTTGFHKIEFVNSQQQVLTESQILNSASGSIGIKSIDNHIATDYRNRMYQGYGEFFMVLNISDSYYLITTDSNYDIIFTYL